MEKDKILVKKRNGRLEEFNVDKINACALRACEGIEDVSASEIVIDANLQIYNKILTSDIDRALIMSARSKIEKEPNYSYAAARLLLQIIYKEVFGEKRDADAFELQYKTSFIKNIKKMVKGGRLSNSLLGFDLKKLAEAIKPERDLQFKYLGLQNVYDRYLLKFEDKVMESPQSFYMRVAMGLSINEKDKNEKAIELYDVYSQFLASPSTPTLFNSGTTKNQLSSCYLSSISDSIDGIFDGLWQEARKSKFAGGLGFHVSKIRATNSKVKGTDGKSSGVIPWLKIYNDMLIACDQGGKRPGSGCAYLENWHLDVEDFIDLRKPTGEERRRTHDMNTALWISDLFMNRVENDADWTLFCPSETGDLTELFGEAFEKRYCVYEAKARDGSIKNFRIIKAKNLWKKMLRSYFETAHPWLTWKDAANHRYSNIQEGALHGSNLCCVTGDQRVPTQKGLLTVKELAEEGTPNSVVGRNAIESATEIRKTLENAPIFEIVTKQGYKHKVTYDHPLWKVDEGWVEAQNLKIGDKVEIQQIEGVFGNQSMENEAFIAGLISSRGTSSASSSMIDIWEPDFILKDEIEKKVKEIISKYKNIIPQFLTQKGNHRFNAFPVFNEATKCGNFKKLRLSSNRLKQILTYLGFDKYVENKIPDFIWKCDKSSIAQYLRGLYIGGASVQFREKGVCIISYSSTCIDIIRGLQIILSNFGIRTAINNMRDAGQSLFPDSNREPKLYNTKAVYRLLISSRIDCKKFIYNIFDIASFRGKSNALNSLKNIRFKRKISSTISAIRTVPNEDVYCLKVLSNSEKAWVCNGFITKNTEIFLHTKSSTYENGKKTAIGETAVCNLHSLNLSSHVEKGKINFDKLSDTISKCVRALDNVIDINFYPTEEASNSNFKHRPIGLGTMGWADVYHKLNIVQDSEEGVKLANDLMEFISYHALLSSSNLAKEKGRYSTYENSLWSKGILPIDTYVNLMKIRDSGFNKAVEDFESLDWKIVRTSIAAHGMRNSNVMAVAPTASISYQHGCEQSHEPNFSVLFVYENKSGNLAIINEYLVNDMKKEGLWNDQFARKVKEVDGDVNLLDIPQKYKDKYKTAFDRDQFKLIDACAARQRWIDQGLSFNSYNKETSLKFLNDIYFHSWKSGLKSNYYLRNRAASKVEKSTLEKPQPSEAEKSTCSIESARLGVPCESCQ